MVKSFVVASNSLREDGARYVIHLSNPVMIFCFYKNTAPRIVDVYTIDNNGNMESWCCDVHFVDTSFPTCNEQKIESVKKRAWRWFREYLKPKHHNNNE